MASSVHFSAFNASSFDDWEDVPYKGVRVQENPFSDIEESTIDSNQQSNQQSNLDSAITSSESASAETVESEEETSEPISFEHELYTTLHPYRQMYSELNIIRKKLGDTSSYQFGLFMMNDICDKLDFIMKNPNDKSTYCRIVIDRLWNLKAKNGDVNIIQLIFSYLSICDRFADADFANSTFDGCPRRVKKEKYDKNYDLYVNVHKGIDQFNQLISDKFTNFCLIFKAFRTIIGKYVKHATGSWDIASFAPKSEWKYSIWNGKTYTSKKSDEFNAFMIDVIDIYIELEKLSPEMDELHAIFAEAKEVSLKQRELSQKSMKNFRSKPSYVKQRSQERQKAFAVVSPTRTFVVGRDTIAKAPAVPAWSKGNPLVKSVPIPETVTVQVDVPQAIPADMEGFVVVTKGRRRK
jgi:hypothetical protein